MLLIDLLKISTLHSYSFPYESSEIGAFISIVYIQFSNDEFISACSCFIATKQFFTDLFLYVIYSYITNTYHWDSVIVQASSVVLLLHYQWRENKKYSLHLQLIVVKDHSSKKNKKASREDRTPDLSLTKRVLYRLSYWGIYLFCNGCPFNREMWEWDNWGKCYYVNKDIEYIFISI